MPLIGRAVKLLGDPAYTLLALGGLPALKWRERFRSFRGLHLEFESEEGWSLEADAFCVFLQNEPTIGGGFRPAPQAEVDDGLLDLVIVRSSTGAGYLDVFKRLKRGTALELQDTVFHRRTRGGTLRIGLPTLLMADGDLPAPASASFTFKVQPKRFRFVAP
jgi:diacylglycerol kinase (ATP)